MSDRKAKGGAAQPSLTVSAIVTVIPTADGGADVHVKVACEGNESFVARMQALNTPLNHAGRQLRAVVMGGLGIVFDGPVVDLEALRKKAGRA